MVTTATRPTTNGATSHAVERTGWTGWIYFASVAMLIVAALQAVFGLIAVVNDQWVVFANQGALYIDMTTWGWVHVGIAVLVGACGLALLSGSVFARTVGVIVAALSLIANFLFLPAYPVWAVTIMFADMMVIWALTVHGSEMRSA